MIQAERRCRLGVGDLAFNGRKKDFYQEEGAIPEAKIQELVDLYGTGRWAMYGKFNFSCSALPPHENEAHNLFAACTYGPPPVANMMWEAIKQSFSVIPGAKFYTREERRLFHFPSRTMSFSPDNFCDSTRLVKFT